MIKLYLKLDQSAIFSVKASLEIEITNFYYYKKYNQTQHIVNAANT